MNTLLIGGSGFLGLNIAKALIADGHSVHIADVNINSSAVLKNLQGIHGIHQIDCANVDDVLGHIDRFKIECVINLASNLIPSSTYESYSLDQANFIGSAVRLLNELATRHINYVYFSSGGAVYGGSDQKTVSESNPKNPISYYGLAKSLFEDLILFTSRTKGLNYLIIRPSNPFGPFQNPSKKQGLIAVAVDMMQKNQPIEVWGDGSVVRDYIWVGDLAQAIARLITKNHWNEIYNLGSGLGHSVNQVLEMIRSLLETESRIIYTPPRSVDVSSIILDIQKVQAEIVFHPIDLKEGITMYLGRIEGA
jgi:UDP-glucose 4-epimerase